MPYTSVDQSHFTVADRRLMARVAERLWPLRIQVEHSDRPGIDYYRLVPIGTNAPVRFVARQYDRTYQLLSSDLRVLKKGQYLREVLPAGWLEP